MYVCLAKVPPGATAPFPRPVSATGQISTKFQTFWGLPPIIENNSATCQSFSKFEESLEFEAGAGTLTVVCTAGSRYDTIVGVSDETCRQLAVSKVSAGCHCFPSSLALSAADRFRWCRRCRRAVVLRRCMLRAGLAPAISLTVASWSKTCTRPQHNFHWNTGAREPFFQVGGVNKGVSGCV